MVLSRRSNLRFRFVVMGSHIYLFALSLGKDSENQGPPFSLYIAPEIEKGFSTVLAPPQTRPPVEEALVLDGSRTLV